MEPPITILQDYIDKFTVEKLNLDESISDDTVEYPPKERDTDLAVNFAMKATGEVDKPPRKIGETLADYLENNAKFLESISVDGPGFVNCNLSDSYLLEQVRKINRSDSIPIIQKGQGKSLLLEFVSANPTGPLHVGHGRGAVYGDVVGRLLEAHGYEVTREYYVNDTGEQIKRLAESLNMRAREQTGESIELSNDHYKGEYVKEIVKDEEISPGTNLEDCSAIGIQAILNEIFSDLEQCKIDFDSVKRETEEAPLDELEDLIEQLKKSGYIYENKGATFLETTREEDDKDRVLIKDDGTPTYFANDLLYHHKKFSREFDNYINVWGHDHHGYQQRVRAGLSFLGHDLKQLDIELYQLVDLYRDGEPVSMSTRQGDFVPLSDLLDEVGVDPVRFNFLTKNHDRPLDFDIDVATSETEENPVYYVQYAHTRLCSLLRKAPENLIKREGNDQFNDGAHELALRALNFPYHLLEATTGHSPHRVTHFLMDFARDFHSYYSKHPIVDKDYPDRSATRLDLVKMFQLLLKEGLNLLGVSAPSKM